jgi:DNA-binding transcriptional ArsR family regulator
MTADLESLHKILKDPTRRKIILSINEKGSLSYTDLMHAIGVSSTGTLNYHLKILADLLTKDDTGQYLLTEKGKTASRLLLEFPEQANQEQVKTKWWRRFWFVAVLLDVVAFVSALLFYRSGHIGLERVVQALVAFTSALIFTYFYYRMIRPRKNTANNPTRSIESVFVAGRNLQEVKTELHKWIADEGITTEMERDDFVRGRLGIPSGLGLTAPKYFEISLKLQEDGVMVHVEGWISVFDVSERSFTNAILSQGNIPRRKGYKMMQNLLAKLKAFSKA